MHHILHWHFTLKQLFYGLYYIQTSMYIISLYIFSQTYMNSLTLWNMQYMIDLIWYNVTYSKVQSLFGLSNAIVILTKLVRARGPSLWLCFMSPLTSPLIASEWMSMYMPAKDNRLFLIQAYWMAASQCITIYTVTYCQYINKFNYTVITQKHRWIHECWMKMSSL